MQECVRRKGWRDKGGVEFQPERDGCRGTGRKEVEEYEEKRRARMGRGRGKMCVDG